MPCCCDKTIKLKFPQLNKLFLHPPPQSFILVKLSEYTSFSTFSQLGVTLNKRINSVTEVRPKH